ncbi:serine/threonine-protein kinase Nek1-like isoform X2 [Sinocyclocheilus grahami]|uniref:serine/threonine-protein kinase Nek1-like isoform X2 n=1 Tax=Sinocyclocheilus grahami TaxID=75366 RepID=UPI0007ACE9F3|nr:PREDICTED: serine/threonine-protein kinase Nek1-like isoform X2 [Sinocyclocheilus grahami]
MSQYHRLSDTSADSGASDHSLNVSAGVIRVLKEHGYTIEEELGRGASGIAFLVKDTDGDPYVVKQMNSRDGEELDAVRNEAEILKNLNFGYIVTYVNSFEDSEAGRIYIVMEYCEGGDLSKVMETHKEERFFEEKQILDWLVQICLALQYLHEKKILHRDIKPQNIFLTEDGYINLGDFGCSKALERADEYANSVVGAKLYVSPEVYQKKYNSKRQMSCSVT